jgi:hypothetical protein
MADDKSKTGKADRSKVATQEKYEMDYLRKKTGASEAEIKKAVDKVGHGRAAIEKELAKKK